MSWAEVGETILISALVSVAVVLGAIVVGARVVRKQIGGLLGPVPGRKGQAAGVIHAPFPGADPL